MCLTFFTASIVDFIAFLFGVFFSFLFCFFCILHVLFAFQHLGLVSYCLHSVIPLSSPRSILFIDISFSYYKFFLSFFSPAIYNRTPSSHSTVSLSFHTVIYIVVFVIIVTYCIRFLGFISHCFCSQNCVFLQVFCKRMPVCECDRIQLLPLFVCVFLFCCYFITYFRRMCMGLCKCLEVFLYSVFQYGFAFKSDKKNFSFYLLEFSFILCVFCVFFGLIFGIFLIVVVTKI